MYYLVRSSEVGGSFSKDAIIKYSGKIIHLRAFMKKKFSDIFDDHFINNISAIDRIDKRGLGVTRKLDITKDDDASLRFS